MPFASPDFSRRALLSEWMDEPCSYADFRDCLRDLERVNRIIFGYRPTLHWLEQFSGVKKRPLHIVDVGCGGGGMLRRIEAWAHSKDIAVRLTGIDLNPHAAQAAREFTRRPSRIEWITGDAFSYQPAKPIDIVVSSLFTHHLLDAEIVHFLQWMDRVAGWGWFINDLHRERVPYYTFGALATLLHGHRFIRHDGLISIRRSFTREDWEDYCAQANLDMGRVNIFTMRPARLCVARVK
ncbi:MAG: methyltransferase domain-containing protein [Silvibacterium sp.]